MTTNVNICHAYLCVCSAKDSCAVFFFLRSSSPGPHISAHRPQKHESLRRPYKAAASSLRKPLTFELLERRLSSHFDLGPSQLESRLVIPSLRSRRMFAIPWARPGIYSHTCISWNRALNSRRKKKSKRHTLYSRLVHGYWSCNFLSPYCFFSEVTIYQMKAKLRIWHLICTAKQSLYWKLTHSVLECSGIKIDCRRDSAFWELTLTVNFLFLITCVWLTHLFFNWNHKAHLVDQHRAAEIWNCMLHSKFVPKNALCVYLKRPIIIHQSIRIILISATGREQIPGFLL